LRCSAADCCIIHITEEKPMLRKATFILLMAVSTVLLAQALLTQTKPAPPKAAKKPAGPAKVSGQPITTPSGLQYWELKKGTGAPAVAGKEVSVHYTGWLVNGKEFDSSLDSGEPIKFKLGTGQVIKGWDEGIAGM